MGDPVFVKDDQSRLVLVNDAFCKLFGRPRAEIIGKTLAEDVTPEEREHFLKVDKQVISDGKESIVEESLTLRGETPKTISTRKTRFVDKDGNKFLICVIRDITPIKQAEELGRLNKLNELLLSAAQLLSIPETAPRQTLQDLAQLLATHFGAVCDISILDKSLGIIRPIAVFHTDQEVKETIEQLFESVEVKIGQGLVGSVIEAGKEVCITDVPEAMKVGPSMVHPKIIPVSLMYVPLTGSEGVLGSLNLTRVVGAVPFSETELVQIRRIGQYISLFVENVLLREHQDRINRFRILAEQEIRLTQERFESLSLNSGDAFFFHDDKQNILDVNQVAVDMLGYSREELLQMQAGEIDPRWKKNTYQQYLKQLEVNDPQTFDTTVFAKDGTGIPVEVRFVKREEGGKTYIQSLLRDRTEKREQEKRLQRSEERLRLIFENVEDHVAMLDGDGIFESINKTTQGLAKEDVIGHSIHEFDESPEKTEWVRKKFEELKATGQSFHTEEHYTGPDGTTQTYLRKFIGIFHGEEFYKCILIIRDVTAERFKEKAEMNAVLKGQEQERKRLGAELHDGIGQVLSAIALQVSRMTEAEAKGDTSNTGLNLKKLGHNLQSAIKEVRNISHDLMPDVLENFGLKEALNQTCRNLEDRSDITVRFNHVDLEEDYDQTLELNLFRITQELLNNVQKHSNSVKVFVSIMDYGDMLSLSVEDDGIGFNENTVTNGIGLKNIRSRVNMLGGEVYIESAENSGTLVNIEVPKRLR